MAKEIAMRVEKQEQKFDNLSKLKGVEMSTQRPITVDLRKKKTEAFNFYGGKEITIFVEAGKPWTDKFGKVHETLEAWQSSVNVIGEKAKEQVFQGTTVTPKLTVQDGQASEEATPEELNETPDVVDNGAMTKADWAEKEKREHRRACLMIATSGLSDKEKEMLFADGGSLDTTIAGMVILTADKYVDFVYSGNISHYVTPRQEIINEGMKEIHPEKPNDTFPL